MLPETLIGMMTVAHFALAAALIFGSGFALRALRHRGDGDAQSHRDRRLAIILIIWLVAPTVGFTLLPLPVHPHYLLLTLPAGQFLAAWGLSGLAAAPRLRLLLAPLLLALTFIFGWSLQSAAAIAAADPTPSDDLQHWTLSAAARLGREVRQALPAVQPPVSYPQRVSAPGNTVMISSASAAYLDVVSDLAYPDYVMLPARQPLLYVLINRQLHPAALGAQEEQLAEFSLSAAGPVVSLVRAPTYDRSQALALPQTGVDWHSEAGLTLLGYDLGGSPQPGQALQLTTYWRVDELPAGRAEWYVGAYYQILTTQWQMLANVSGHGQWARRWQEGDVYVERITLPLPQDAGEYQLLLGLNDPIHLQNYAFHSPEGPQQFLIRPLFVTSP